MSEEKQYPVHLTMDASTWAAIERGKDFTDEINAPLNTEEKNIVHGPIISNSRDMEDYEDQPHFEQPSTAPEAIATNPQEFKEMKEDWQKGQTLQAMHPDAETALRWICDSKVQQVRDEQDSDISTDRDAIANQALRLRYHKEAYDYLFNTIMTLKNLKEPTMLQPEEK